jgi:dihydroneopterin aldolase
MSTYYPQVLSIQRLELATRLGCYAKERQRAQQVEVTFRFYFPEILACSLDDKSSFIDYDIIAAKMHEVVEKQEFRLIEYMAMQLHGHARAIVDECVGSQVKIWLKLLKVAPPVPHLRGGTAFVYTDLPADARVPVSE